MSERVRNASELLETCGRTTAAAIEWQTPAVIKTQAPRESSIGGGLQSWMVRRARGTGATETKRLQEIAFSHGSQCPVANPASVTRAVERL
ncbi:hypothetical protein SKAU_G00087670 [Synaphobranchus kaupii]|uniref:Uncharacterized protein n=1 Tax=Synaphobranchus kaupii TaxID=118154 RepID=A0A9Q1FVR0_SYNKA|nr:hypothetical protein SKAU_G00087670 [Synaphobranchus kaupii]